MINAIFLSVLQGFIGWFFPKKTVDEKSAETLVAEKQETIEKVGKANEIRDKLVNDAGYNAGVYPEYQRKDD
ncbi:MAG: hypothetical protein KGJ90_06235 [Patescibacteria group bacterium]|nr:hypothetical protein [Patescibacteria group bacterium]